MSLDRVPRRAGDRPVGAGAPDAQGKQALFSRSERSSGAGRVSVRCSRCRAATSVGPIRAVRLLVPSLYVPLRAYPSLLRCPACQRISWCRLSLHL